MRSIINRLAGVTKKALGGSSIRYQKPMPCPSCDEPINIYADFDPESKSQVAILGAEESDK